MNLIALTIAQIEEVAGLAEILAAKSVQTEVEKPRDFSMEHIHDIERQHLVTAIDQLSPTAKDELLAFMWLGQGSIGDDLNRWDELVQSAQKQLGNDIPNQLASEASLHEYLRRGLKMIGQVQAPICSEVPAAGAPGSPLA